MFVRSFSTAKKLLQISPAANPKLEQSNNLPDPDVLAQEITEELEAALEQFREIAADLGGEASEVEKS
jgi:type I restriction enzyme M protein